MTIATVIGLCNILLTNNCIFNKKKQNCSKNNFEFQAPLADPFVKAFELFFFCFREKKCLLFSFEEDNTAMLFVLQRVSTDSEKEKKD
jgi:hypothetical protein